MSDTPRTDAELRESRHGTYHVVPAEFSRQLERELAQLVNALRECLGYPRGTSGRIIIERDHEERHRALLRELCDKQ